MAEDSPTMAPKNRKKTRTASKTTATYWSDKIFLEKKPGWESSNYFVRMQAKGARRKIRLDSTVREEAAREAVAFYLKILAEGWPDTDPLPLSTLKASLLPDQPTISEWIELVKTKVNVRSETVDKYAESLRTIVGEILNLARARKPEQRQQINSFLVSALTKETLKAWFDTRMENARKLDHLRSPRAQNTVRTLITNARALFCNDALEAMGIDGENLTILPFSGLKLPPRMLTQYTSRFDAPTLLETAARELGAAGNDGPEAASKFEQWKILYLALVAGLRYNEIDQLRVHDIIPVKCRISIRTHETFRPKTKSSEGDIRVSESAATILSEMLKRTPGKWFIKDGVSKQGPRYRAGIYHDAIVIWLRQYEERGIRPFIDVPKPLHELRKEAGTIVNSLHGLNEAQTFLRHGSIVTTASYYVGSKGNITTDLS